MPRAKDAIFWAGKKVLVTGHTGFKGAWLTLLLRALGAEVHGLALPPPTVPSLYALLEPPPPSVSGDILTPGLLAEAMKISGAEVAFHLAAQALVGEGWRDPAGTFAVNVQGTVNFLEAARGAPRLRAAVVVTSDKCYRNDGRLNGYAEEDPLGGEDPYSASKAAAELAVAAWRPLFSGPLLLASARAGNVVGGGDFAEGRLAPDAMKAFSAGRPLVLRRPGARRPWQHVLEPLSGYLDLAKGLLEGRRELAGPWNFGPDLADCQPAGFLAGRLAELWGGGAQVEAEPAPAFQEAETLTLNSGRARASLGWRPRLGLERALAWTVEWYRAFYGGGGRPLAARPLAVAGEQIKAYLAL